MDGERLWNGELVRVESMQEGELLGSETRHVEPAGVAPGAEVVALLLELPEAGVPEAMQLRAELSLSECVHRELSALGRLVSRAAATAVRSAARSLDGCEAPRTPSIADLIPERDDGAVVA